ncbi:MAG TPA: hypothetical protein VGK16_02925 [Candidatus Limnocylindrales bacterium]|jgi:hypothetical protein
MASTDTRSGFRLPWSSDRSHEDSTPEAADAAANEGAAPVDPEPADPAWPQTDINAALGLTRTEQRPVEASPTPTADTEEPSPMIDVAPPSAVSAPRKPSKLMADLSAAIRATAEAAQAQTLDQVATDSQQVVEAIRASSTDGAAALKSRSDEDLAAIREWSKAEIARIREETDERITARKATLEDELAGHAAAVERRVEEVNAEVARFEAAMAAYRDRLERESDPARLATMAEEVPETPTFEAWTDLGTLDISHVEPEAVADPVEAAVVAQALETVAGTEPGDAVAETVEPEAVAETPDVPGEQAVTPVEDWYAPAEEATGSDAAGSAASTWGDETTGWTEPAADVNGDETTASAGDDVPRWAAGKTPDGFPQGDTTDGGDPVDRGAIMAALEAAAEAVVAAESAAESADQAEAAADVAETAAELLVGRTSGDDEYDPEAAAAMTARVDAGGYDTESYADRLASLMPGHVDGAVGDEERTTQVVVNGLVSVASIASFKRHLGRLAGVKAVAVASGPEGEFVFNVTHRADLSFRDGIPTMPGFAARVTGAGDGVVNVTARDPEAEG